MPQAQDDCPSQVLDIIKELSVWKDESHKQMSIIMSSHSSIVNKGFNDIGLEFSNLQAKVTTLTKERSVLLNTIQNLNNQITQMGTKLRLTESEAQDLDRSQTDDTGIEEECVGTDYEDTDYREEYTRLGSLQSRSLQ